MVAVAVQFSVLLVNRLERLELYSNTLQVSLSMHEPMKREQRSAVLQLPSTIDLCSIPEFIFSTPENNCKIIISILFGYVFYLNWINSLNLN